jgi:hypothetical protein
LVDLDATTAKPPANQAEAHRAENHRAIPDKMASLIDRGEERIQPGDTDKKSLAVGPRPAMDADDTLAVPARSRRDSPPVKENLPHRTLRHTEIPPGSRDRGPDRVFAALASASPDTAVGRLRDALSQDLAALEAALQDLLADRAELGRNLTDWFMGRDVFRWTVAATIALVAAEIVRRKAQRAHADAADPAGDSEDVSVRLFPELLGLPPRVRT